MNGNRQSLTKQKKHRAFSTKAFILLFTCQSLNNLLRAISFTVFPPSWLFKYKFTFIIKANIFLASVSPILCQQLTKKNKGLICCGQLLSVLWRQQSRQLMNFWEKSAERLGKADGQYAWNARAFQFLNRKCWQLSNAVKVSGGKKCVFSNKELDEPFFLSFYVKQIELEVLSVIHTWRQTICCTIKQFGGAWNRVGKAPNPTTTMHN